MELNVGDYVRTKDYQNIRSRIGKIIKQDEKYYYLDIDENTQMVWEEDTVLKSSPNIIDLIQEGDYVNGYLIEKVYDVFETSPNKLKEAHIKYADEDFISQLYDTDIKSIVTKEQFEEMQYLVKED